MWFWHLFILSEYFCPFDRNILTRHITPFKWISCSTSSSHIGMVTFYPFRTFILHVLLWHFSHWNSHASNDPIMVQVPFSDPQPAMIKAWVAAQCVIPVSKLERSDLHYSDLFWWCDLLLEWKEAFKSVLICFNRSLLMLNTLFE